MLITEKARYLQGLVLKDKVHSEKNGLTLNIKTNLIRYGGNEFIGERTG